MIEEVGSALKRYLQSESAAPSPTAAMDVFAVYIELAQNIREYSSSQHNSEAESSATVVVGRDAEGRYEISAGNIIDAADGEKLCRHISELASLDKAQLKARYKEQLRKPRENTTHDGAGLGLIDIARKAAVPVSCHVQPINSGTRMFFSLRVVI